MADGWIKLHRSVMESKTFSRLTAIQKLIAIYIILNANHKDGVWHDKYKNIDVPVKRGQLVTSRNKIKNEWFKDDREVTEQKIRTTLNKLDGDFLTMQTTKAYTLLTVLNYDAYQAVDDDDNQANNQTITKEQPSDNQGITTNKNDKKVKNDKKEYITPLIIPPDDQPEKISPQQIRFNQFWSAYPKKRSKGQAEKAWGKIRPDEQLHNRILSSLERAKTSTDWTKDGGQYIPYPATWLNAKGWEDEIEEGGTRNGNGRSNGFPAADAPTKSKYPISNPYTDPKARMPNMQRHGAGG